MLTALRREPPAGIVPIWELEFHAWNQFSNQRIVLGREFEALPSFAQERALRQNAEIMATVAEQLGFAAVTAPAAYWEQAPGELAYYVLPEPARFRQVELLREAAPDRVVIGNAGGVIGMPGPHEFEEFTYKLYDDPAAIEQRARDTLQHGLANARRLVESGAHAVFTASDMADNHGPYFNPEQFARFLMPYLRAWADGVHALGVPAILHSDGQLMPCLPDIVASGVDALQAIDPVAGMDLATVKAAVGNRLCLCGNLDCGLLLTGTPEQNYEAARQRLLIGKPGGAFVLGASNAVQPDVPRENYEAIIAAWRDHGRYD